PPVRASAQAPRVVPEPETAMKAGRCRVALVERVEDVRQRVRRYTDPVIAHGDLQDTRLAGDGQLHAAGRRAELRGILQQVRQNLRQAYEIAVQMHGLGGHRDVETL